MISLGRYELYERIGSGGTASVYLGRMRGPYGFSKVVAIKRLHAALVEDKEFVSMQVDEARLAGHIRHPNVASMLDLVEHAGEVFVVLEYVHGEALSRLLRESADLGRPVPVAVSASIAAGALRGLHAAHEAVGEDGAPLRIVHRDVSPQNILVGVDGLARVLDFGTAKAAWRRQETLNDQIKGKLGYMPPEQLHGEGVDRRADVFASGVVLWEMLCGERLFDADSEPAVIVKVLQAPIPAPSARRPEIPPALDAVVLRALARERDGRFATALAMAQALDAAVEPASAAEVGQWVRSLAAKRLLEREQALQSLSGEGEVAPAPPASPAAPAAPRATPLRRRALLVAAGTAVAGLSALALRGGARGPSAPSLEPAPSPAPAAPTPTPPPPAPLAPIDAGAAPSKSLAPAPRPARAKAKSAACSPPFYVTGDGHKHFKPECL